MKSVVKPIASYIRRITTRDRSIKADRFELRFTVGRSSMPIEEFKCVYPTEDVWIESVAEEIHELATQHAATVKGRQAYNVFALSDEGGVVSTYQFSVYAEETANPDDVSASEEPDSRGLVSQSHRHLERILTLSIGAMQQTMTAALEENRRLAQNLETAYAKREEVAVMIEELSQHKHEREIALLDTVNKSDERKEMFKQGKALLMPYIAEKVGGKAGAGIAALEVKGLLDDLSPEQRAKMAEILTPDQVMRIAKLHATLDKTTGEEEKKKAN